MTEQQRNPFKNFNKDTGGAEGDVGTPGRTMEMMSYDDKTRPISRTDLFKFVSDEKNVSPKEKEIIQNSMIYGLSGTAAGFFIGWQLSGLLPWRWLEKHKPFPSFIKFGRFCFGMSGASIPFMVVQQWTLTEILKLDEQKSVLAFHAKRLLVTQRSSLLFTRGQVREVTKEEQKMLGQQNVTIRQQESRAIGGSGSSVDVNLALQQQVLTPHAQTGYKNN